MEIVPSTKIVLVVSFYIIEYDDGKPDTVVIALGSLLTLKKQSYSSSPSNFKHSQNIYLSI